MKPTEDMSTMQTSPVLPRGVWLEGDVCDLRKTIYLSPCGILSGTAADAAVVAGHGWPLANETLCFTALRLFWRRPDGLVTAVAPFGAVLDWSEREGPAVAELTARTIQAIARKRVPFAGFDLDRPVIMGILNCTPDSFSDGGEHETPERAIAKGRKLLEEGADILDIGGESTRPGAHPISREEEIARIIPVIRVLAGQGVVISVDTRHASVMEAAVKAGARIVNDISALEDDPAALEVVRRLQVPVILMHKQGNPQTMQNNPVYQSAALDVYDYLAHRIDVCSAAGIPREMLCVDPGIGFGKALPHNLSILSQLGLYHALGCPILLGASRKRFIADIDGRPVSPKERLGGALAAAFVAFESGVQIVRVHDVAETCQAASVWRTIRSAR